MRTEVASRMALLAAVIGVVTFRAATAEACDCDFPRSPAETLAQATAVFEGYVVSVQPDPQRHGRAIWFQVLRAWKGAHADMLLVVGTGQDGGDCGVDTPVGTTWLVYGFEFEGQLFLGLCSR